MPKGRKDRKERKLIRRDVKRDIRGGSARKADPVEDRIQLSKENARQAALAVLDPKSAIERGFLPGFPDGVPASTIRWSSKTTTSVTTVNLGAGPTKGIVVAVGPRMGSLITTPGTIDGAGVPAGSTVIADSTYTEALSILYSARAVAQVLEVRCVDAPLSLEGDRTITNGAYELYNAGIFAVKNRRAYTIGNNKPGEVSRCPRLPGEDEEFSVLSTMVGNTDNCIHFAAVTGDVAMTFELTVWSIWEGLPEIRSLLTPSTFVADPEYFNAAISAALNKCPLESHERISYDDDGIIDSVASDVKTILGHANTIYKTGKKVWEVGSDIASAVGTAAKMVTPFLPFLMLAERKDSSYNEAEEDFRALAIVGRLLENGKVHTLNHLRTLLTASDNQQLRDLVVKDLHLPLPPWSPPARRERPPSLRSIREAATDDWESVRSSTPEPRRGRSVV